MPTVPPLHVELRLSTRLGADESTLKTYCLDTGHDPDAVHAAQAILAAVTAGCSAQDMMDRFTVVDGAVVRVLDVTPSAFELFLHQHCANHPLPAQVNAAFSDCLHTTTGDALPPAEISNDKQFKLLLIILVCAAVDVACVMLWKGIIRRNRTMKFAWNPDLATRMHEEV